jgi:FKBP-type peptidyl-prolyl cis-trans isomerase 2
MTNFIKISYTGRLEDGKVFDTTSEKTAKDEGIYDDKRRYAPLLVVVGQGQVIKGLDEALDGMKVGDKKKVDIPSEKAYGKKNPELVRIVPLSKFKEQKMTPFPGMPLEIDGRIAHVQTVAGGRVRVDFNHELAGRTLTFEVKVEEEAESDEDKIKFLLERDFESPDGFEFKRKGDELTMTIPDRAYKDRNALLRKAAFSAESFQYLGLTKITFSEVWEKAKEKT